MRIQRALNSDIVMIFDECTPYPATEMQARESMELSLAWAERSRVAFESLLSAAGFKLGRVFPTIHISVLEGFPWANRRPSASMCST